MYICGAEIRRRLRAISVALISVSQEENQIVLSMRLVLCRSMESTLPESGPSHSSFYSSAQLHNKRVLSRPTEGTGTSLAPVTGGRAGQPGARPVSTTRGGRCYRSWSAAGTPAHAHSSLVNCVSDRNTPANTDTPEPHSRTQQPTKHQKTYLKTLRVCRAVRGAGSDTCPLSRRLR